MLGLFYGYTIVKESIARRAPYDLVIIDAPQYYYGRDGCLPLIYNHLAENALIVLDDAGRSGEKWSIFRWLETFPSLKLRYHDSGFPYDGIAILEHVGRPSIKISLTGLVTSLVSAYTNYNTRKQLAKSV